MSTEDNADNPRTHSEAVDDEEHHGHPLQSSKFPRLTKIRQRRPFLLRRLFFLLLTIASYLSYLLYKSKKLAFIYRILYIFVVHAMENIHPNRPVQFLQQIPVTSNHILERRSSESGLNTLPNVIFILADDLGYNDISGGAGVSTPHIDSIAKNGIRFLNAYTGSATCAPSRSAQMTGRYPMKMGWEFTCAPKALSKFAADRHGDPNKVPVPIFHPENYDAQPEVMEVGLPLKFPHAAALMKEELSYWNFFFGKWDSGYKHVYSPIAHGFHESLAFHLGGSLYLKPHDPRVTNIKGMPMDTLMRHILSFKISHNNSEYFEPDEYMTDYLSNHVVKLIHTLAEKKQSQSEDQRLSSPFYISLNYNAVHDPYQALKTDLEHPEIKLINSSIQQIYAAMVHSIDRGVGKVLNALKETNQYENTIVIFTSDNGPADYAEMEDLAKPFRGWKSTLFEGGIHVPFFLQWPRMFPDGNIEITSPIMQMDLPPSYLHFPSIVSPLFERDSLQSIKNIERSSYLLSTSHEFDGRSLWPVVFRELYENNHHDATVSEESIDEKTSKNDMNELDDEWSEPRALFWRSGHYKALRINNMKMQVAKVPNKVWFYNLTADPSEFHNLAHHFQVYSQEDLQALVQDMEISEENVGKRLKLSSSSLTLLKNMIYHYQRLLTVDGEQHDALWQPVLELQHCLDKSTAKICTFDDEWVMWPN